MKYLCEFKRHRTRIGSRAVDDNRMEFESGSIRLRGLYCDGEIDGSLFETGHVKIQF